MTPFILWFSLPKSSGKIVDFIRDVSVYVDGLGYVCKYATFDVKKKNPISMKSGPQGTRRSRHIRKSSLPASENSFEALDSDEDDDKSVNKMMRSYMYFMDSYQNNENAVGKHQLPRTYRNPKGFIPATNYSWKRQFQPGKRSQDFYPRAEGPSVEPDSVRRAPRQNNRSNPKAAHRERNHDGIKFDDPLGESFINHIPIGGYTDFDVTEDKKGGNGVLGLLNQYYKKSDVGR